MKEPFVCDIWKELLISFPGSVSADEDGQRIFISDTNHHRIIVANANGRVLDCIGSSPGFEDGPFETAQADKCIQRNSIGIICTIVKLLKISNRKRR